MQRLIVGVLATVAVAANLTAAPAQADQRSFTDRASDVGHAMDIHRVTVRNDHRLVVTLRHRAVSERGGGWSGIYIDVTPAWTRALTITSPGRSAVTTSCSG